MIIAIKKGNWYKSVEGILRFQLLNIEKYVYACAFEILINFDNPNSYVGTQTL